MPVVKDPCFFASVFNVIQDLIEDGEILAGHDISAGGMLTTLLEMCFANTEGGAAINLAGFDDTDTVKILLQSEPR